jgi:hypothetical protein
MPDLKVVRLPGRGRPQPPEKLDRSEQRAWRQIVDSMPDGFADGAAQIIIRRTVAQNAIAERMEDRLRRMAERGVDDIEAEIALGRAHREAVKSIIAGLTALRAAPRARAASRDTGRAFGRSPSGRRPWDPPPTIDQDDGEAPA